MLKRYREYREHGHTRFTSVMLAVDLRGLMLVAVVAGLLIGVHV